MFIIGKILQALVLPPGSFIIILALLSILSARSSRKAAAIISGAAAFIAYVLSIGPTGTALCAPLERRWPPLTNAQAALGRGATYVVTLGGGVLPKSPEYGAKASLTGSSAMRAAAAFRIARETGLPLLYTGGSFRRPEGEESEAEAAKRFWIGLGADPSRIRIETESWDTDANARFTAVMVGKGPVVLVTSAFHMPRAVLAFKKAGVDAIPAPTDYRVNFEASPLKAPFLEWLPRAEYLETTALALHEYMGLLYYAIK